MDVVRCAGVPEIVDAYSLHACRLCILVFHLGDRRLRQIEQTTEDKPFFAETVVPAPEIVEFVQQGTDLG